MTGKVHWTKTGTNPVLTARAGPSSAIGVPTDFIGGTFETIAGEMNGGKMNQKVLETMIDKTGIKTKKVPGGTKSPHQSIANTTAVTKGNKNGMGCDCPPSTCTNDAALDHLDSGVVRQEQQGRQEFQFAGTCMCI